LNHRAEADSRLVAAATVDAQPRKYRGPNELAHAGGTTVSAEHSQGEQEEETSRKALRPRARKLPRHTHVRQARKQPAAPLYLAQVGSDNTSRASSQT
jgi:hypothetical protein